MQVDILNIQKLELATADEKIWDDLIGMWMQSFAERNPGDPVPPASVFRQDVIAEMESEREQLDIWVVYDSAGDQAIATYDTFQWTPKADDYESKKNVGFFEIYVAPEHRRNGLGTQLLKMVAEHLKDDGKTTIEAWVSTRAGDAFMVHMGAQIALQMKTKRLLLSELDWAMVEDWAEAGPERNPQVELILTDDIPDDAMLPAYAALLTHIFGQMPKQDSEGFPETVTPDSIRERFDMLKKQNYVPVTLIAREPDGTLSAITDVDFHPERPHVVFQGITGVHLDHRGRGLGKWLKAAMLLEVKRRFPDAQYIDTANANVNAPMLHINEKLGFRFHKQNTTYKLMLDALLSTIG